MLRLVPTHTISIRDHEYLGPDQKSENDHYRNKPRMQARLERLLDVRSADLPFRKLRMTSPFSDASHLEPADIVARRPWFLVNPQDDLHATTRTNSMTGHRSGTSKDGEHHITLDPGIDTGVIDARSLEKSTVKLPSGSSLTQIDLRKPRAIISSSLVSISPRSLRAKSSSPLRGRSEARSPSLLAGSASSFDRSGAASAEPALGTGAAGGGALSTAVATREAQLHEVRVSRLQSRMTDVYFAGKTGLVVTPKLRPGLVPFGGNAAAAAAAAAAAEAEAVAARGGTGGGRATEPGLSGAHADDGQGQSRRERRVRAPPEPPPSADPWMSILPKASGSPRGAAVAESQPSAADSGVWQGRRSDRGGGGGGGGNELPWLPAAAGPAAAAAAPPESTLKPWTLRFHERQGSDAVLIKRFRRRQAGALYGAGGGAHGLAGGRLDSRGGSGAGGGRGRPLPYGVGSLPTSPRPAAGGASASGRGAAWRMTDDDGDDDDLPVGRPGPSRGSGRLERLAE